MLEETIEFSIQKIKLDDWKKYFFRKYRLLGTFFSYNLFTSMH